MNADRVIDIGQYAEWTEQFRSQADSIAGLDDMGGDWRKSLKNYKKIPFSFPTFHDTDPWEFLDDLIAMARERPGKWLGISATPPRQRKGPWVREVCDKIPDDLHVHMWAGNGFTYVRRIDSVDTAGWFREAMGLRTTMPWLTYQETLEIVMKKYQRHSRVIREDVPGFFDQDRTRKGTRKKLKERE